MFLGYKEVHYVFIYLFFGFLQPFSNDPLLYFIQHGFICRLSDCTATEPGTTAKFALTIRTDNLKSGFYKFSLVILKLSLSVKEYAKDL